MHVFTMALSVLRVFLFFLYTWLFIELTLRDVWLDISVYNWYVYLYGWSSTLCEYVTES